MLSRRWGNVSNSSCGRSDAKGGEKMAFNTGNYSNKKVDTKAGDINVKVGDHSDPIIVIVPILNGANVELLSNPQAILGAITGFNDNKTEVEVEVEL
jgi:hypothetical protein